MRSEVLKGHVDFLLLATLQTGPAARLRRRREATWRERRRFRPCGGNRLSGAVSTGSCGPPFEQVDDGRGQAPSRLPAHEARPHVSRTGARGVEGIRPRRRGGGDVIEAYLDELSSELGQVGIRGRLASAHPGRVGGSSAERPGRRSSASAPPAELANTFAAELGTRASAPSRGRSVPALAFAGAVYAVSFLSAALAGQPAPDTWPVLAQLALPVRSSRRRSRSLRARWRSYEYCAVGEHVLPSAELTVIHRRTGIALLVRPRDDGRPRADRVRAQADVAAWWVALTLIGPALAAPLLLLAALPGGGAARFRPRVAGPAGDLFDDLGFRADPWRFARPSRSASGSSSSSSPPSRAIRSTAP